MSTHSSIDDFCLSHSISLWLCFLDTQGWRALADVDLLPHILPFVTPRQAVHIITTSQYPINSAAGDGDLRDPKHFSKRRFDSRTASSSLIVQNLKLEAIASDNQRGCRYTISMMGCRSKRYRCSSPSAVGVRITRNIRFPCDSEMGYIYPLHSPDGHLV
jgi:hypothetical protein